MTIGVGEAPIRFSRAGVQSQPGTAGKLIPAADQVEWCLKHLGEQITGVAVGAADGDELRKWADEILQVGKDAEERLSLLFALGLRIETRFDDETAQRFFTSANAFLDDEAPLELIATMEPDLARARIMGAVRVLLGR